MLVFISFFRFSMLASSGVLPFLNPERLLFVFYHLRSPTPKAALGGLGYMVQG